MKPARWTWLCVGAVLWIAHPVVAAAEEYPEYDAAMARAKTAYNEQRFPEAAELFKQAFDAEPRGNLLYNIGLCYEKSDNIEEAIRYYERFIAAVPGSKRRPAIQTKIGVLKQQITGRYVAVSVVTDPPGAVIFVNDKAKGAMGQSPIDFKLLPGRYTIIAELDEHESAEREIDLIAGDPVEVDLRLSGSEDMGRLKLVITERDASVLVNGKRAGRSPFEEPLTLPGGQHEIQVMKPGFATWKQTVDVPAGEVTTIRASLAGGDEDDFGDFGGGSLMDYAPYATMGVGALLMGAGVARGTQASSLHDKLSDRQAQGFEVAQTDIERGNSLVLQTNLLFIVGAGALIGGGVWWWFSGNDVEAGGETLTSDVGIMPDGSAGVWFRGTFR